jgi:hypothetical protein
MEQEPLKMLPDPRVKQVERLVTAAQVLTAGYFSYSHIDEHGRVERHQKLLLRSSKGIHWSVNRSQPLHLCAGCAGSRRSMGTPEYENAV